MRPLCCKNVNGKFYDRRDYFKQQVTEQLKINSDKCENVRGNTLSISANRRIFRFITSAEH